MMYACGRVLQAKMAAVNASIGLQHSRCAGGQQDGLARMEQQFSSNIPVKAQERRVTAFCFAGALKYHRQSGQTGSSLL